MFFGGRKFDIVTQNFQVSQWKYHIVEKVSRYNVKLPLYFMKVQNDPETFTVFQVSHCYQTTALERVGEQGDLFWLHIKLAGCFGQSGRVTEPKLSG